MGVDQLHHSEGLVVESRQHHQLKRSAAVYARGQGYAAVACEVRCPISRYRADVAGFARRPKPGRTLIIECKQSRADFIRDRRTAESLLRQRRQLLAEGRAMEAGQSLLFFGQSQGDQSLLFRHSHWVSDKQRHHVRQALMKVERALYGHAKFALMTRYCLADQLLIAAPTGMIAPLELPLGWGLLEFNANRDVDDQHHSVRCSAPVLRVAPEELACQAVMRQRLVANIAVAATRENAQLRALWSANRKPMSTAENTNQACDHAVGC